MEIWEAFPPHMSIPFVWNERDLLNDLIVTFIVLLHNDDVRRKEMGALCNVRL